MSSDVLILCGGLGTRLRKVLPDTPKPMAEIAGRPFLQLLIEQTATFGFRRFVLCIGYRADDIESFFGAARMSCDIEFSRETQPLGTAGAIWNARNMIHSDPFLVLNGDSFCGVDLPKMIEFSDSNCAEATIAVVPASQSGDYGRVVMDRGGRITSFLEKDEQTGESWVNGGVYLCRHHLLDALGRQSPLSLERDVFPSLVRSCSLFAFRAKGPLLDIGTPERYEFARKSLVDVMRNSGFSGMHGKVLSETAE